MTLNTCALRLEKKLDVASTNKTMDESMHWPKWFIRRALLFSLLFLSHFSISMWCIYFHYNRFNRKKNIYAPTIFIRWCFTLLTFIRWQNGYISNEAKIKNKLYWKKKKKKKNENNFHKPKKIWFFSQPSPFLSWFIASFRWFIFETSVRMWIRSPNVWHAILISQTMLPVQCIIVHIGHALFADALRVFDLNISTARIRINSFFTLSTVTFIRKFEWIKIQSLFKEKKT